MRNLITLLVLLAAGACPAAAAPTLTLIGPSSQPPTIIIDLRATPPERFAARELQEYLGKITGKTPPIRADHWVKDAPAGRYIAVGKSKFTADLPTAGLATEQYIIDVTPDHLAIVGGPDRQRGVLYGVYDLLEQLGVRWYRPEPWGEHVPRMATIELACGRKISKKPDYEYRSDLGGGFTRNAESSLDQWDWAGLWAVRHRLNGSDPGSDPRFGGQVSPRFDHIYYQLIPVEEYFDKHPEYFCLYKGQRRRTNPDCVPRPDNPTGLQLCLSNLDLQDLFARKTIEQARGRSDLNNVTLSATPNDACPFCECDRCKAMDDPKNPGSMSNRVCAFTNIIARKVAEVVPGARISLNVYSTWTAPPTLVKRMEPNILIHTALINEWADYTKPFAAPAPNFNQMTRESFEKWKQLGVSEIYTYEYWSGYAWLGPLPLARTMADRIREYRRFNVKGIYNETEPSWGPHGLDLYMFAELIWNPDLDVDKELNLYYQNYYGPAAVPMKAYHETLMDALAHHPYPVTSGGRGMHLVFTPKLVRKLGIFVDQAQRQVKGQPLYERRLAGVRAGYEFARRVSDIMVLKKTQGVRTPLPAWPGRGYYLKSPEAEKAFNGTMQWVRSLYGGDATFDISPDPPYCGYLKEDILDNDALGVLGDETNLLREFIR